MSDHIEYVQVKCPADGSQQIVELAPLSSGTRASWCSRELTAEKCDQACLRCFNRAGFLMSADVPSFQLNELQSLSLPEAMEKFENTGLSFLPVVNKGKLVGELELRRLALWQDSEPFEKAITMDKWIDDDVKSPLQSCASRKTVTISVEEPWQQAVKKLLESGRNEIFVVDSEHNFKGAISARTLLELSTSFT